MAQRWIVRSEINPDLIYCQDGQFRWTGICGPGGFKIRVFKTAKGAMSVRNGQMTIVEAVTSR